MLHQVLFRLIKIGQSAPLESPAQVRRLMPCYGERLTKCGRTKEAAAAAKRQDTLRGLGATANPGQVAEALKGNNPQVGKMSEDEQRSLVQASVANWDARHDANSAAALKDQVKDDPKLAGMVNDVYQSYGTNKLSQDVRAANGEFTNSFEKHKPFTGGCLADPHTSAPRRFACRAKPSSSAARMASLLTFPITS